MPLYFIPVGYVAIAFTNPDIQTQPEKSKIRYFNRNCGDGCLVACVILKEKGMFVNFEKMEGVPPVQVLAYEQLSELQFMGLWGWSVIFLATMLGGWSDAGFAGIFGILRMAGELLAQVGLYERLSEL